MACACVAVPLWHIAGDTWEELAIARDSDLVCDPSDSPFSVALLDRQSLRQVLGSGSYVCAKRKLVADRVPHTRHLSDDFEKSKALSMPRFYRRLPDSNFSPDSNK